MAALLDKFGCEPLVGSFMERVEMPGPLQSRVGITEDQHLGSARLRSLSAHLLVF